MPDREKVIKAFECCKRPYDRKCEECPYEKDCCHDGMPTFGLNDALALLNLLKEQERQKGSWDYGTQCSVCKGTIIPPKDRKVRVNFCPWCGADMRGGEGCMTSISR